MRKKEGHGKGQKGGLNKWQRALLKLFFAFILNSTVNLYSHNSMIHTNAAM